MTQILINNIRAKDESINGIKSLKYFNLGNKTYSASMVEKIYGVFTSNVISAPSAFIRWNNLDVVSEDYDNLWMFIRTYKNGSTGSIADAIWQGPFKGATNDISAFSGEMIQIMIIMDSDVEYLIESIKISFSSSQNSSLFFTKAFNVGFNPKHLVLTYNGTIGDNSIVRFAISGEDTDDIGEYQYVEPNKIQELNKISIFSERIKLMMEIAGDSGVPVVIDEIALTFSGDEAIQVNKLEIIAANEPVVSDGDVLLDESGNIFSSEEGEVIVF